MTEVRTLAESFEAVVTVLREVRDLMHELGAREAAGEESPSAQRAYLLAWPAIGAKWATLRAAGDQPGALSRRELAVLIAMLHRDLILLREVLAGRVALADPTTN